VCVCIYIYIYIYIYIHTHTHIYIHVHTFLVFYEVCSPNEITWTFSRFIWNVIVYAEYLSVWAETSQVSCLPYANMYSYCIVNLRKFIEHCVTEKGIFAEWTLLPPHRNAAECRQQRVGLYGSSWTTEGISKMTLNLRVLRVEEVISHYSWSL